MIQIGNKQLANNVVLAPMSGISDAPFRKIAFDIGAGLVVSEMVASEELVKSRPDVTLRATNPADTDPFVIQLAGREAKWMSEAAKISEGLGADIIDINMGCPARQVTGALSGSALMRNADHALSLVEATVRAVSIPVTLKMRLGWDHDSLNAPEIAQRAESAGVQMITVHGRTRQQFYKGEADWALIRNTKQVVSVPVIANGDIISAKDAREALRMSGADGVMIGRAAVGQPWLLSAIAAELNDQPRIDLSPSKKAKIATKHYLDTVRHYEDGHHFSGTRGRYLGIRMARKHLADYVEKSSTEMPDGTRRKLKATICRSEDPSEVVELLDQVFTASVAILDKRAA